MVRIPRLVWFSYIPFLSGFFEKAAAAGAINAFLSLSFGAKLQVIILIIILARMVYSTTRKMTSVYRIFLRSTNRRNEPANEINLSRWVYPSSLEKSKTISPKR